MILFILFISMDMPPKGALRCPSKDEPTPKGIIGHLYFLQILTTFWTSSLDSANTTPSGNSDSWIVIVCVCCSNILLLLENCCPNSSFIS